jgi:hypothetical protein
MGSPPPLSAHQRRRSKGGEPGPDPWRGADHGGACGSDADQEHSESSGSEDPEGLRPALLLELQRSLLYGGNRHQAARAHGMGSGIKEPDPCPGRIKTGRLVLDANPADQGGGVASHYNLQYRVRLEPRGGCKLWESREERFLSPRFALDKPDYTKSPYSQVYTRCILCIYEQADSYS